MIDSHVQRVGLARPLPRVPEVIADLSRQRRLHHVGLEKRLHRRRDELGWDHVIREGIAHQSAVLDASRIRVVNRAPVKRVRKVAVELGCCRNRVPDVLNVPVVPSVIRRKEEAMVFDDRPAEISTELVLPEYGRLARPFVAKRVPGAEVLIAEESETPAPNLIRAGLRRDIHDSPCHAAELRLVAV